MVYHPDSPHVDWIVMIKYIGIGIASLALVGCTQAAPAPVVTVTAPAPVVTVTPPAPANEYQTMLDYVWSTLTANEKSGICYVFNTSPQEAWDAFNEGAQDSIPQSEFNNFFSSQCNAY